MEVASKTQHDYTKLVSSLGSLTHHEIDADVKED